jgi:hypothetical protein
VASRQEQKEQRRQERLAREQAEAKAAARRKRVQYLVGGLLALAAVAGVIVLLVVGLGDGDGGGDPGQPGDVSEAAAEVKLPAQESGDLEQAAKAAGCKLTNPEIEGSTHEPEKEFAASDYKTNPPTSGNHNPDWYDDGVYPPGGTPRLGELVHTLEHGRINLQYKEGTPREDVLKLEALYAEQSDGYHMLLYQNTTGMEAAVAATAWGHSVTCPDMNDKVFDALRTFRSSYIDKGPEAVP